MPSPARSILIGEAGWPSKGRMREVSLPSRINQGRFISELLDRAGREKIRVNVFEAYDEPWKRQWEGTVGAHWGLFDGDTRQLKHAPGSAVSNYPFWKLQLGAGLAFGASIFLVALLTLWRRPAATGLAPWLAVSACATTGGILLGLAAEKAAYENYGVAGMFNQGLLLTAAITLPLLCANALMAGRPLPAFRELVGPREGWPSSLPALVLGFVLMVTTLVTVEIALGLVFDPRSRDFPFASLTMAAVPVWTVALLCRRKSDAGVTAEAVFAGLLAAAALFLVFNEGVHNWQSLWTAAAFVLFGAALWRRMPCALDCRSSYERSLLAVNCRLLPPPKPPAAPPAASLRQRQRSNATNSFALTQGLWSGNERMWSNRFSRRHLGKIAGWAALGLSAGSVKSADAQSRSSGQKFHRGLSGRFSMGHRDLVLSDRRRRQRGRPRPVDLGSFRAHARKNCRSQHRRRR